MPRLLQDFITMYGRNITQMYEESSGLPTGPGCTVYWLVQEGGRTDSGGWGVRSAQEVQAVLCTVVYRRAVEQILVDGEYGLLKRSRLCCVLLCTGGR